jgi:hypothetical protein
MSVVLVVMTAVHNITVEWPLIAWHSCRVLYKSANWSKMGGGRQERTQVPDDKVPRYLTKTENKVNKTLPHKTTVGIRNQNLRKVDGWKKEQYDLEISVD